MSIAVLYPHVEKVGSEPARLQRLPRIRVAQIVMDYLAHGWSPDEMLRQHPYLKPAEVHAAMGYYFDHQAEIDSEIKAECAQVEALKPTQTSPILLRMRAKGIV